jgi:hypothetical protein
MSVLPWVFRGQVPAQSPYNPAALQNMSPRLRRHHMEVERSLHQCLFFPFVLVLGESGVSLQLASGRDTVDRYMNKPDARRVRLSRILAGCRRKLLESKRTLRILNSLAYVYS